jgi:hypothetical protein
MLAVLQAIPAQAADLSGEWRILATGFVDEVPVQVQKKSSCVFACPGTPDPRCFVDPPITIDLRPYFRFPFDLTSFGSNSRDVLRVIHIGSSVSYRSPLLPCGGTGDGSCEQWLEGSTDGDSVSFVLTQRFIILSFAGDGFSEHRVTKRITAQILSINDSSIMLAGTVEPILFTQQERSPCQAVGSGRETEFSSTTAGMTVDVVISRQVSPGGPRINMVANPNQVWANGHEITELKARMTDANGQGIPGRTIRLSAEPQAGVVIEPEGGEVVTDAQGESAFQARSTEKGLVTFTATDVGDPTLTSSILVQFVQRRVVVFVQGVNTELFPDTDSTIFPLIRERLVQRGFSRPAKSAPETGDQCVNSLDDDGDGVPNDGCPLILNYSYNGVIVDPATGIWSPNPYIGGNTAHSLFDSSIPLLKNLIEDFSRENPNTRFVIIGHSQGGLIALRSLELVFERSDLLIDAVITLDGALGGAPELDSEVLAALSPWGDPAKTEMIQIWETAPDHSRQGTLALNNQALVEFAQNNGTRVLTIGSSDDCVWNHARCGLLGFPDNSSTQIADVARWFFDGLGGNCLLDIGCIYDSHSAVLTDSTVLNLMELFLGPPTVP